MSILQTLHLKNFNSNFKFIVLKHKIEIERHLNY